MVIKVHARSPNRMYLNTQCNDPTASKQLARGGPHQAGTSTGLIAFSNICMRLHWIFSCCYSLQRVHECYYVYNGIGSFVDDAICFDHNYEMNCEEISHLCHVVAVYLADYVCTCLTTLDLCFVSLEVTPCFFLKKNKAH
jgi:hypothetical protein